jgi:hypothetical protein
MYKFQGPRETATVVLCLYGKTVRVKFGMRLMISDGPWNMAAENQDSSEV